MVGGVPCRVLKSRAQELTCEPGAIDNGDYTITVRVGGPNGRGLTAPITTRARVRPIIDGITPIGSSSADTAVVSTHLGGSAFLVTGSGLVSPKGTTTYRFNACDSIVKSANLTHVYLIAPACGSGKRNLAIRADTYSSECPAGDGMCAITFTAAPKATAAAVPETPGRVSIATTATGVLDAPDGITVTVGNDVCAIASVAAGTLLCDLPAYHPAGDYPIIVTKEGLGRLDVSGSANIASFSGTVTSVSPAVGSRGGSQSVTIVGSGFSAVASHMAVRIAGAYCAITAASPTQIVCTTSAVSADISGPVNVTISAPSGGGVLVGASFAFSSANTPLLTSVTPSRGSTAGGTMLTITGSRFTANMAVTISGVRCTQTQHQKDTSTATTHYCTTGPHQTSRGAALSAADPAIGGAANALEYGYIDLWSRWTTWGNNPPPAFGDSAVISEGQTVMMDYDAPRLNLILVMGHLIFDETRDITVEATYIMINFGKFTIGTPEAPYVHNAVIRLFGDRLTPEIPVHGSKVLALRHGALDMHGIPRQPTFTKLAETAYALSSTIKVRGPVDWKAGEEIVITSTDFKMEHAEPRTIVSVANPTAATVTISLSAPLHYTHNGQKECFDGQKICIEEIADVMLLTRNIKLVGDNRTHSLGFGATMFLMPMGQNGTMYARLSYVEFADVGQQYIVGRYPVHYHVTGALNNSYVKGCAVHRSLNRGYSIHGISNNTYVDNVAYDVQGHCYFIEDGDEAYNNITHNIAALVHVSTSNLNTDLTPAAFWVVSAKNFVVNNIAAGSAAYGFWIAPFYPYSTGPGYSTSVCPSTHPMIQFEGNEAHSSKKYGLNFDRLYYPKKKECDWNGPDAPSSVKDFFSWKNKIHGATMGHSEVGEIGSVTFDNFVAASNGEDHVDSSAFWVEHIKAANMTFGLRKAVLIGQTSNAPHVSVHTRRGINLPLGDNFFAEDVTFINYEGQNFGIEPQRWAERMSFCFPWGWEALFRRTRWVNAPNKMRMRFHHHGIINDEDGTFGSGTPNTQIIPISPILDPAHCKPISGSPLAAVAACTANHKLRRFGLSTVSDGFSDQLFTVEGRKEMVPLISRFYSMSIPANRVIDITFQTAYNPNSFDWTTTDRFRQIGEKNIFQTVYKELRAEANASFDGVPTTMMARPPTLQDTANGYYFGDKKMSMLMIAPAKALTVSATTCPWSGCPPDPVEAAAIGGPCTPWEDASSWVDRRVPVDGADLRVNYTESVCLSIPGKTYRLRSLYLGGKIEVNSSFCKKGEKITLYVEKYIHIRGGILQIGSQGRPLECEFEMKFGPVDFLDMESSTVAPFAARALVFESGTIEMHGSPKTRIAYLAATTAAQTKTLVLDRNVNWVVGDTLAISQTRREAPYTSSLARREESEEVTIAAIDGRTVTLSRNVAFTHFGAPTQILNGVEYSIGAEIICLTRNVKITAGYKKGDVVPYNMGWNFHIGCTALNTPGCGSGDSKGSGFPMGALKPGSVRMDSVQIDDVGQEGSFHAAISIDGLVTSTADLTARSSFIRNCALNRVRAVGINVHSTTSAMEISNNVIFDVHGDGIRVGGRQNIIDGNVILKNSPVKPLCKFFYDATVAPDCVGGAFRINSGNTVRNNIAASGDGIGFIVFGEPCDQPFNWNNNFAVRHQDGMVVNDLMANGATPPYNWDVQIPTCRVVGGVNVFSNGDQGVAVWYVQGDVTVRNVVSVDNMFGLTAILFNNKRDRGDTATQYIVEDSVFAGHWTGGQPCRAELAFRCRVTMLDSLEWCNTIYNEQMGRRIRGAGILEAVFTENSYVGHTMGESKFMWIEPDSYGAIKGRAQIRNVVFDNFDGVNECGQREVAYFQNFFSNDTSHHHTFEGIQWGPNVKTGGEFYYWGPYGDAKGTFTEDVQTVFLNYDDPKRGGYWPDGPHKVWLTDIDGSFTRLGKQQTIFGSRTIARTATFDKLKYDGRAFRNGGAPGDLKPGCIFVDKWNAYQCEEKKYVSLSIESLAEDALTRRVGPIVMCKGDGRIGSNGHPICEGGEVEYASGPTSKGKVHRATQDRMSRWRFTVEVGHNYTLSTRGQPPVWMRMWLHDHEPTGLALNQIGIVVNLRYFGENSRMRVGMYVNGVRRPAVTGFGLPNQLLPPIDYPSPLDAAGTHYHNLGTFVENGEVKDYNTMSVTLKPSVFVDWKQESIIIVTTTVAMTEDDFFANKATFTAALADALGIPPERLKFATIAAGTHSLRRQLLQSEAMNSGKSSGNIAITFHIGAAEESLEENAEVQPSEIATDLPEILEKVKNMSSGVRIGDIEVHGMDAEVATPQIPIPDVFVSKEYDFVLVNISRENGERVNATHFTEGISGFARSLPRQSNQKLTAPEEDKDTSSIAVDSFAVGNIWNFHTDGNHTRMTLFFALPDDVRESNELTGNLGSALADPAIINAATPAGYRINSVQFTRQNFDTYDDDENEVPPEGDSNSLSVLAIALIAVGASLLLVISATGAIVFVRRNRHVAFSHIAPLFADKEAPVQEMRNFDGGDIYRKRTDSRWVENNVGTAEQSESPSHLDNEDTDDPNVSLHVASRRNLPHADQPASFFGGWRKNRGQVSDSRNVEFSLHAGQDPMPNQDDVTPLVAEEPAPEVTPAQRNRQSFSKKSMMML